MLSRTIRHLRGNVIAYVALFIALSAGAYAASNKAPKNSVVAKSIAKNAVKTNKIANEAVTEAKVTKCSYTDVTAFTNGWGTAIGLTPGYCKDVAGFVHLRGRLTGTTEGTSAFTLPEGFRPAINSGFGAGGVGGGASIPCVISIQPAGTVTVGAQAADAGCVAAGQTFLDGITFKAG